MKKPVLVPTDLTDVALKAIHQAGVIAKKILPRVRFESTVLEVGGSRDVEAALQGGMTLGGTTGMSATLKNEMAASETLFPCMKASASGASSREPARVTSQWAA